MKNYWKGCFRQSKLQNFLHLPTMMTDRIFRHIPTNCLEFEMIAKKWNYQIAMTTGIQNAFQVLQLYFTTAIDSLHGKLTEVWNVTFAPSDFHFPEAMWTLLRKLPYIMKFYPKVKSHFWSHVKMLLKFENSEANEHGYLKTNECSKL